MRRAALLAVLAALTGCSSGAPPTEDRVQARLGSVDLVLEVADDERERARGLMNRTSVPAGTGMLFRYDAPSRGRFYMYKVTVPLKAVFIRDSRVVFTVLMPPCASTDPAACPTYGPDAEYDTVVETSPETLPAVQTGDLFQVR